MPHILDVVIVGSGVGGLTAAIGLRRAGHRVTIFERAPSSTAFGAGVVVGFNASKVLTAYGVDYEAARMSVARTTVLMRGDSLEFIRTFDNAMYERISESKQYYAHRVDLQDVLVRLATQQQGMGLPVQIVYNSTVVSYNAEGGTITLQDGSIHTGDLVVAADGVHSLAPRDILGTDYDAVHTGTTIIRFMLPSKSILSDPQTSPLLETEGQFSFYVGPDRDRWLLQYPVRNGSEQNFGMYSRKNNDYEVDAQVLRFHCDKESLRRELEGFHDSILALVPKTTEILPVWKLAERPPLPTWFRGRLVIIGDAAHPMLPNQGQGAGMAIEDSGALGVVFGNMDDASAHSISERLALFQRVRKGRASVVQLVSHIPYWEDAVKIMYPQLLEHLAPEHLPPCANTGDLRTWFFAYNVLDDSARALHKFIHGQPQDMGQSLQGE